MKFEIGFDTCPQLIEIPDRNVIGVLEPERVEIPVKGEALVRAAIEKPVGTRRLSEMAVPGQKIAIVTSDVTRPLPSRKILPAILEELARAGVSLGDIVVVFALGIHRGHTPEEMRELVGDEVFEQVRCVDSDPGDCLRMGTTALGTPVDVTRAVAEADLRVCLGNIEYHYFAGYSGGAKAIMPGVSTRAAIQSNHSRMVLPEATAGRIEGNPVREDIEEAIRHCPVDFILNVVLDEHKEIAYAAAGHYIEAHRAGVRFLDAMYRREIPARADIVIASQGGAPKDLNLYQTQKALDNAKGAVKPGGVIILVGSCKEGLGEETFERWMTESPSPAAMIERIGRDFELGGHKATAIALVLREADVYLVSEMPPAFVEKIFLTPFATIQPALDAAFEKLGHDATVLVMPYAGSTLPMVRGE